MKKQIVAILLGFAAIASAHFVFVGSATGRARRLKCF